MAAPHLGGRISCGVAVGIVEPGFRRVERHRAGLGGDIDGPPVGGVPRVGLPLGGPAARPTRRPGPALAARRRRQILAGARRCRVVTGH